MAIDFTGTGKAAKPANPQDALAKALENLQKFSGPIFTQAVKSGGWGSTRSTETFDSAKAAEEERDKSSFLDKLLGAAQGALTGVQMGQSFSVNGDAGDKKLGTILGAIGGAASGIGGFTRGRSAGIENINVLNKMAHSAAEYEQAQRQQMANDAVASMTRGMAELSSATDPKTAALNAKAKRQIVSDTAQKLVQSGVAPDKAIQTSRMIAALHDPAGEYSPAGERAAAAWAQFSAIPQKQRTKADKDAFVNAINGAMLEENIKSGKLPANLGAMLGASGGGGGGGMPQPQMSPMLDGPVSSLPGSVPPPSGAGRGGIPLANAGQAPGQAPSRSMMEIFGNPFNVGGVPGMGTIGAGGSGNVAMAAQPPVQGAAPQAMPQREPLHIPNKPANAAEAKQAFGAQGAWRVLDEAEALIKGELMPDNMIEAAQANFSEKGLDMAKVLGGMGTALGGLTGTLGAGVGALPGAMIGGGIGGALGSGMGSVGKGASWGMSTEKEIGLNHASQLQAQLQTYIGEMMGNSRAGNNDAMVDIIKGALGNQSDSVEERLAAIQLLRNMVKENAMQIGAFSEEKSNARAKVPGIFFFD